MNDLGTGLQLIRLRQRRMALLLAGLAILVLAAPFIAYFTELEAALIVALLLYGGLLLVYSLRLALTDCPRCDRFYHLSWWANPFTKRCLNCGLRLNDA